MTLLMTTTSTQVRPVGWRYRLLGIGLGALLMFDLASFYGPLNVIALFSHGGLIGPWDVFNNSLFGLGFASYMVPYGLLAGWVSSEASLGLAKPLSRKLASHPRRRRVLTAMSTALATLTCSVILSLAFGFQILSFYGIIVIVVFGAALLGDPWLNERAAPDPV